MGQHCCVVPDLDINLLAENTELPNLQKAILLDTDNFAEHLSVIPWWLDTIGQRDPYLPVVRAGEFSCCALC